MDLEEIVNNSEDSKYSNDSNQSYDSDISPQNITRSISFESKKDDFSDEARDMEGQRGLIFFYSETDKMKNEKFRNL